MDAKLYDTCILIEHMRKGNTIVEGSTTILNLIEFPKAATLDGLNIIIPGPDDYDKGFELSLLLLKSGTPIPAVDIVIAAVSINRDLILHTKDQHFKYVTNVDKEFHVKIE